MTELVVKNIVRRADPVRKGLWNSIIPPISREEIGRKPLIFDMNDFCPELGELDMLDASLVIEMLDRYENGEEEVVAEVVAVDEISEVVEEEVEKVEKVKVEKKKRDYSFVGSNHKNKHKVKATNLNTDTVEIYESLYKCQNDLCINAGIIKMCCEGLNHVKSGISKKNNQKYKFEYTDLEPTKLIERVRKYKTAEEKRLARNKYTLKYQRTHKEKIRACQRKYYEKHKGDVVKGQKKSSGGEKKLQVGDYFRERVRKCYERERGRKKVGEIMDEVMNEVMAEMMDEMILQFRGECKPIEVRAFDINVDIV
ncbi:MAG: hypothetical protein Hyperionvirus12_27 [Hyperionvirus sp.]|uniref:Uncharacterized protein n=1 Tax=Hyperionvirus sp. TaxID=2487770 RepID=A0A3G5A988_9VIRU|nr:MAG: hypothetical protein Hyperionvirus12_27 [Hyperionvirus sp.]